MNIAWNGPAALERMRAWWSGEDLGRPALHLVAPRSCPALPMPTPPESVEARWTDLDYRVAYAEAEVVNTAHFAEAVPGVWPYLGPVPAAAFFGAPSHCRPDTIWREAIIEDWSTDEVRWDRDNYWWRLLVEYTERLVDQARDRYLVANGSGGCSTDVLSYLRGPERLCLDLLGDWTPLVRARDYVTQACQEQCRILHQITSRYWEGDHLGWLPMWAPGSTSALQVDFSCMISPQMFRDFCLPEMRDFCRFFAYPGYHLDGPGAIRHLDALLEIEELRLIQWEPGAGQPDPLHPTWRPLLRRIVEAGKIAYLRCTPEQVLPFLEDFPYQRCFFLCWARSEDEARRLLRDLEQAPVRGS